MIAKRVAFTSFFLLSLPSSGAFQPTNGLGQRTPFGRDPLTTVGRSPTNKDGNHHPPNHPQQQQQEQPNRRDFLHTMMSTSLVAGGMLTLGPRSSMANAAANDDNVDSSSSKVLVLGGTGFVGSRVVKKLQSMGIQVIATSRDGRDGTVALDVTTPGIDVSKTVQNLASGCSAVISTIGSIGTPQDLTVNAATGLAAVGAKAAGISRFVYISVAPEVREFAKDIDFLKPYMQGKSYSQDSVTSTFGMATTTTTTTTRTSGVAYTLIEPTFIYGGDSFNLNPPRVAGFYGEFIEAILSSGPLRAITNLAPEGFVKIALEPPVSVDIVVDAAVAGALGKAAAVPVLDTHDKIMAAAAKLAP